MRHMVTAGLLTLACFGVSAIAQDWYHEREERYRDEQRWRHHVFEDVRSDLDHIWSAARAKDKERHRLDKTKEELTELQAKLDRGHFDEGELNDVIDHLRKSANDEHLAPRDRDVLTDDLNRLMDYREHHEHW